ncbi:cytochrome C oxidase subunit IV family protein [Mycolicibacterium sp. 120266]|uniref:cytochrome C oxidase subunit IV family protein n=1 Tax=Mycolicibacterium sp. 120266 TaxID=3090601 RepID=UPI00299EDAF9|nr:cytochrome C oxidase subunit IV family protein [Mycolicibacterium sp. 120266]MDX1875103.1 cytochrome C oxidase subunit IV family protein [Mycolicibacterium sp. 120266]
MMLKTLLRDRTSVVWFVLVAATLASWTLGVGHELPDRYAAVGIIVIAFVKVHFVGRYFMELRDAPSVLKAVFGAWNVGVAALLIGLYLVG